MARHARTNCFLLFTYNQSLFGATATAEGGGGLGRTALGRPPRSSLLIPRVQVFPVPRNQTTPSLCPSLLWLMLSPSLLPPPGKLLEGIVYSADPTAFSLSPFSTLITSTVPQTPHAPDPRTTILCPVPGLGRRYRLPSGTSQETELCLRTSFSISRVPTTSQIL